MIDGPVTELLKKLVPYRKLLMYVRMMFFFLMKKQGFDVRSCFVGMLDRMMMMMMMMIHIIEKKKRKKEKKKTTTAATAKKQGREEKRKRKKRRVDYAFPFFRFGTHIQLSWIYE